MKIFNRWNGKLTFKAFVYAGQVKVEPPEKDGKLTLDEYTLCLLMLMAQIGREAEQLVAVRDRMERDRQLAQIRGGNGPRRGDRPKQAPGAAEGGGRPKLTEKPLENQGPAGNPEES